MTPTLDRGHRQSPGRRADAWTRRRRGLRRAPTATREERRVTADDPRRRPPLALRRLRQPHPLRRRPAPGVRPSSGTSTSPASTRVEETEVRGRVGRVGDLPLVRPRGRDRAGRPPRRPTDPGTQLTEPAVTAARAPLAGRAARSRCAPGSSRWPPTCCPTCPSCRRRCARVAAVRARTPGPARRHRRSPRRSADDDFRERVGDPGRGALPELAAAARTTVAAGRPRRRWPG